MTDEPESAEDATGSILNTVTDVAETFATGIPAPVRKGAIKAFGQLLSAAIDVPVAALQGAADEKRAESKARIQIIEAQAKRIAEQTGVDPAFVDAASYKFAKKIVREQVNLDKIVEVSADQLKHDSNLNNNSAETQDVNPDWLNAFESIARNMSSEQMQALFGKILAGEISKPLSFSIKTVNVVSQLHTRAANLFRILASMLTMIEVPGTGQLIDVRVIGCGNAAQNTLAEFGLTFDNLNLLQENGLIISDYNCNMDYSPAIIVDNVLTIPLTYNGKTYALRHKDPSKKQRQTLDVNGVGLTNTGRELAKVVEKSPVPGYEEKVIAYFDSIGYVFGPVNIG